MSCFCKEGFGRRMVEGNPFFLEIGQPFYIRDRGTAAVISHAPQEKSHRFRFVCFQILIQLGNRLAPYDSWCLLGYYAFPAEPNRRILARTASFTLSLAATTPVSNPGAAR